MKQTRMSKAEFIDMYCWGSQITLSQFDKDWVAMPCDCGDIQCRGWAVVANNAQAMQIHRKLYIVNKP